MRDLKFGGIYSIPTWDDGYYIFVDKLTSFYTGEVEDVLLFKFKTPINDRQCIILDLENHLAIHTMDYLRRQFIEYPYDLFCQDYDGYIGTISDEMLERLQRL